MLVLTRRVGESIVIHDDIYCTVLGYFNNEIRLAFDAPKHVPIHRDEIQRRIYRERNNNNWVIDKLSNKENIVDRLIYKFKSKAVPVNAY